jgi:hypothetical protein
MPLKLVGYAISLIHQLNEKGYDKQDENRKCLN